MWSTLLFIITTVSMIYLLQFTCTLYVHVQQLLVFFFQNIRRAGYGLTTLLSSNLEVETAAKYTEQF